MNMDSKYLSARERRQLTVKTVLGLAAVKSLNEITTTVIAGTMGISQGGVFRHFATKDEIWSAVMEWVSCELYSRVETAASTASTPIEALRAMFISHVLFAAEFPGVPRLLFGELQRVESTPAKRTACFLLKKYTDLLIGIIEQGQRFGDIDASIQTSDAAINYICILQGILVRSLLFDDVSEVVKMAHPAVNLYIRSIEDRRN
jgi:AcrR family transcriptional regulator